MSRGLAVAVLGTGTIGEPVARNLARAGFRVRAWNRTPERAALLADEGVDVAGSPRDAVAGADVLVTLLTDGDAVEEVMSRGGGAAAARDGAVWIQSSTVGISAAERLAALAAEHGLVFVDAPVLGTKQPAERGELVVFASGPAGARATCDPVFEVVAKAAHWLGEAGAGTRMKLVVNSWLLALVEGAAEAIALAGALGVDPERFLELVQGGPVDSPYLQLKGTMMIERRFDAAFKLSLAEKDARLVLEAAKRSGVELPLVAVVREALARGVELGHGDDDFSALVEAVERERVGFG